MILPWKCLLCFVGWHSDLHKTILHQGFLSWGGGEGGLDRLFVVVVVVVVVLLLLWGGGGGGRSCIIMGK